jgi:uncharacterized protein YjiS (DUF1127 family)
METDMSTYNPVLPLGAAIPARAARSLAGIVARAVKAFVRARRNRSEAMALAGLDRSMLRDIGITQADLNDAFASPFWEDPTTILKERAIERRLSRAIDRSPPIAPDTRARLEDTGLTGPAARAALVHCGLN